MRVRLGFKDLPIPNQLERARYILKKMTGNPRFPAPNPTLAFFANRIDALERAYIRAADRGKKLIQLRTLRVKEMLAAARELAAYVQMESHGEREAILSSGFDVVQKGGPLAMSMVMNLRTYRGIYLGSIHAVWKKVRGAVAYIVEISPGKMEPGKFVIYRVVAQTRMDLTGLKPGGIYWIRITAVGRSGYGPPSSPSVQVTAYGYARGEKASIVSKG